MTIVYIDGQNFLYKAAGVLIKAGKIIEKQDLHTLDIRGLLETLLNEKGLVIKYYGTKVRKFKQTPDLLQKTTQIIDSQRRLRNTLAKQGIQFIEAGKLKVRDGDICRNCGRKDLHLQEKGVDVRIGVDMIVDAELGCEKLVLLSSDTDLLPPVHEVTKRNKKVVYVGFSDKTTNALVHASSELQVIRDNEILQAFDSLNPLTLPLEEKTT